MMKNRMKRVSPLEWEIMSVIWQFDDEVTVRNVLEKAYPEGEKAYTTVQTVMNKLVEKEFLSRNKIGLANFYRPVRKEGESAVKETRSFLDRTFKGSFSTMLGLMLDADELSEDDLRKMRHMIDQYPNQEEEG